MPLCPVCETPRTPVDGRLPLECPTCGLVFEHAAVDASVVPLAELEPTRAQDLIVPIEATPGLELTSLGDGGAVQAVAVEGLEATVLAGVTIAAEVTPGLEPTRATEEELPSAIPAEVRCRYCGTTGQKVGLFCDTCGMRLPRLAEGEAIAAPLRPEIVCKNCGGKRFASSRCVECGSRQPATP